MAITHLMHMKESPGIPHTHLRNAIDYILDVKNGGAKTNYGEYVGGNSGLDHTEILQNFLETKKEFEKMDGRQGYHFVISFAKGETDAKTAYNVIEKFCEEYLGDAYDYVFAVHTDKEHMHGHIIFNSVSRISGYKYHYKKGDWAEYIQPVTDKICQEYGLQPLTFDENHKVGMSYAEWNAKQNGNINWRQVMKADIDFAIEHSDSFEMFAGKMKEMGYRFGRNGYSKEKREPYMTFVFDKPNGKAVRLRSSSLGKGYTLPDVMERIQTKGGGYSYENVMENLWGRTQGYLKSAMLKSTTTYKRMYQAVNYYRLPNPFAVPAYRVRSDMLKIDKLIEDCSYLRKHNLTEYNRLKGRKDEITHRMDEIKVYRKTQYKLLETTEQPEEELIQEYTELERQLLIAEKEKSDCFENIQDKMEELEKKLPEQFLQAKKRIDHYNQELKKMSRELRVLNRIMKTESETMEPQLLVAPKR